MMLTPTQMHPYTQAKENCTMTPPEDSKDRNGIGGLESTLHLYIHMLQEKPPQPLGCALTEHTSHVRSNQDKDYPAVRRSLR